MSIMRAISPQHSTLPQELFNDKKINVMTVCGVLTLHAVIGFGLINMPVLKLTPPTITPPIEVTLVTPPPPPEILIPEITKPETLNPEVTPEPRPQPQATPKAEPVKQEVTKPVEKPQPTPIKPIKENIEPKKEPISEKEQIKEVKPVTQPPKLDQNILAAQKYAEQNENAEKEQSDQQRLEKERKAQQNEINRQQALANQRELDKQRELAEQDERNKKQAELAAAKKRADDLAKQKTLDDAKAKKDAEDKAEKDRQKIAQSQNNTPVKISAAQARWRSKPNFSCDSDGTEGQTLSVTIHYVIDKAGNVMSSTLSKPTGNRRVDSSISQKARLAKFYPYIKDGVAVNSNVDISMLITCR